MSLPTASNTTCDVYRSGNAPPAAPDVSAVPCFLRPAFREGQEATVGRLPYTHVMLVAADVDVRDWYVGGGAYMSQDAVYVPSGGTAVSYYVRFVERVGRGTPQDHKRVYLDRVVQSWPTDDL
jgi:hypothetical protein